MTYKPILIASDLTPRLELDERLFHALLISHFLESILYTQGYEGEIEDVTFDKERKKVQIMFKKRKQP